MGEWLGMIGALSAVGFWHYFIAHVIVYEYQKGLLYTKGSFVEVLGSGKHYFLRYRSSIKVVDTRKSIISLQGQEILTKDGANIKVSVSGFYEVADPAKAIHATDNYLSALHSRLQIILRDLVSAVNVEQLLDKKIEIDAVLFRQAETEAIQFGLKVSDLAIKDIMLPPHLKKAFSAILEAQKEALRQLEKARGEQAVLRSLANSAQLYEGHPMLFQTRLIQALSGGSNNIVLNTDGSVGNKEKAKIQ
jgi:regulator of protease activity HflC (stomatin/prohibitin superfamily)